MSDHCVECGRIVGVHGHKCPQYDPPEIRFWSKVEFTETCWLWKNGTRNGYGAFSPRHGQSRYAHRWAYEFCVGSIPEGLDLDHLCRVTRCVRPDHLEPVTRRINVLRGQTVVAVNAAKTHCSKGHDYTPENTNVIRGHRKCRTCNRMAATERRHRARITATIEYES